MDSYRGGRISTRSQETKRFEPVMVGLWGKREYVVGVDNDGRLVIFSGQMQGQEGR